MAVARSYPGNSAETGRGDREPLYRRVRTAILDAIGSGRFAPGSALPAETDLARDLGVSQGTVRKALDELAAEQVVVRRQGSGTYVAEHTPANVLFRFFNLYDASGAQIIPDSLPAHVSTGVARREERQRLHLAADAVVIRIARVRTRDGRPFMLDRITLPAEFFPGLASGEALPNTLYDLFQRRYRIQVARTEERVGAAAADAHTARRLSIAAGTACLTIDRTTFDLADRRIEWRRSIISLGDAHYFVRL